MWERAGCGYCRLSGRRLRVEGAEPGCLDRDMGGVRHARIRPRGGYPHRGGNGAVVAGRLGGAVSLGGARPSRLGAVVGQEVERDILAGDRQAVASLRRDRRRPVESQSGRGRNRDRQQGEGQKRQPEPAAATADEFR